MCVTIFFLLKVRGCYTVGKHLFRNIGIVCALLSAVGLGVIMGRYMLLPQDAQEASRSPLYWIDPMEPQIHYKAPGQSHMGMKLEPVYAESAVSTEEKISIRISPRVLHNLGVRTAPVIQGIFSKQIETVGYVEADENKLSHIHSYAEGWVEDLLVKTLGETVKKGEVLLKLYAPKLVEAQEEYLLALRNQNPHLIQAAYSKLLALRISRQQIERVRLTRKTEIKIDLIAPTDGVVTALNIREGMRVTPATEMMVLADLKKIWVIAEVFEKDLSDIKVGQEALLRFSFDTTVLHQKIDYIYPQIDPKTRTLNVRFVLDNPTLRLKPNMYADLTFLVPSKPNALSIPIEALIRSRHENRVIVMHPDQHFEVRKVVTGFVSGDRIEILKGLKPSERVVTSGQFLIDSEANLQAGFKRLE